MTKRNITSFEADSDVSEMLQSAKEAGLSEGIEWMLSLCDIFELIHTITKTNNPPKNTPATTRNAPHLRTLQNYFQLDCVEFQRFANNRKKRCCDT